MVHQREPDSGSRQLRHLLNAGTGTGTDGQAKATDINKDAKPRTAAGLANVYAGPAAAQLIGVPAGDERVPDLIGIVQHGVVYNGKTKKIAEHGGDDPQDRDVPLVIAGSRIAYNTRTASVETTQIAPTILTLLCLDPNALQAVRSQHTPALPTR